MTTRGVATAGSSRGSTARWATVLMALAGVVTAVAGCGDDAADGPLQIGDGDTVGVLGELGGQVAFASTVLANHGDDRITISSVALLSDQGDPAEAPVSRAGIHLLGPDGVPVAGRFPDASWTTDAMVDADGVVLEPGGPDVVAFFVVDVVAAGVHQWDEVEIRYAVRGRQQVATQRTTFVLCAPADPPCDFEAVSRASREK